MACCVRGYHVYTWGVWPPNSARCRSSRLADAIAADGKVVESDPFGSGRLLISFKYRRIDMRPAIAFQDLESHENCMHCIRIRAKYSSEKYS